MNRKVSLKVCFLFCLISMCVTSFFVVNADEYIKEIKAYLNYDLKIIKDDSVLDMTDTNGAKIYPITYNGTTYLPVRYIGNITNLDVEWNGPSNSVVLTTNVVEEKDLLQNIKVSTNLNTILAVEDCKLTLPTGVIKEYENGLNCNLISNQDFKLANYIGVPTLESSVVSFIGYSSVRTSINVFNQQGKLVRTIYLNPNVPTYIEVNIDNEKTTLLYFVGVSQVEEKGNSLRLFNIVGK